MDSPVQALNEVARAESAVQDRVAAVRGAARTHKGESALAFHLAQWSEECDEYTQADQEIMLRTAIVLVEEKG